jgi:ketosteroid isomerase-like protein
MTREEILAFLQRQSAAWAAHDAAALARGYAPHAIVTSPTGGVLEGPADVERIFRKWLSAFPDLKFQSDDVLIEGDRVVQIARVSGTHTGEFFGVGPTGRKVDVVCALLMTLADGLIVQERRILDFTGVLIQVGVLKARPSGGSGA